MNYQYQSVDAKKKLKLVVSQIGKKILVVAEKHFVITGITTSVISGFIFYIILLVPGYVWAEYHSDSKTTRDVQLMLYLLQGTKINDPLKPIKIDGKLGKRTAQAITNFETENNLPKSDVLTNGISDELYLKLRDRAKSLLFPDQENTETNPTPKELDILKEDLKNTNAGLKALSDSMSDHFISTYSELVAVVGASLGIVAGLLGGVIAWYVPKTIEDIKKEAMRIHDEKIQEADERYLQMRAETSAIIKFKIYINLSCAFYRYYRLFLHNRNDPNAIKHLELEGGVSLAAWFTDLAIEGLHEYPDGEKKNYFIKHVSSHKAYHCASQHLVKKVSQKLKNDALSEAYRLRSLADDFYNEGKIDEWLGFMDTAVWIFIILGEPEQQMEARSLLQNLSKHENFPEEFKENYRLIGEEQYLNVMDQAIPEHQD